MLIRHSCTEINQHDSTQHCLYRRLPQMANLPNRYSALCLKPVTHAQTWASYSTLYRFGRLSPQTTADQ